MITGAHFKDDHDYDLQNQQHGCYREVLGLIADRCIRHYKAAERMTGRDQSVLSNKLGRSDFTFDHRILQSAHDIMASYWRWHTGRHEPHMPGLEPNGIDDWKAWARQEVDDWALYAPEIVRHVVTALAYQNTDNKGYQAEEAALTMLKDRYSAMLDG